MRWGLCLRSFAVAVVLFAAVGSGHAQTPPTPRPSPDPSPNPTPVPPFHSPFNGDRDPTAGEAQDFGKLMELYDAMMDAQARLAGAQLCNSGIADAIKAMADATAAFNTALATYLDDWSNHNYVKLGRDIGLPRTSQKTIDDPGSINADSYKIDRPKVMDELAKQDKKQHVVGACPAKPGAMPQPTPTPAPAPAPAKPAPPCYDEDVVREIAEEEKALAQVESDLVKVDRDVANDRRWLEMTQLGLTGPERETPERTKAIIEIAQARLNADQTKQANLRERQNDLKEAIKRLQKLKVCPAPSSATPPPPPPPPPPKADGHSGILRCPLGSQGGVLAQGPLGCPDPTTPQNSLGVRLPKLAKPGKEDPESGDNRAGAPGREP